MGEQRQADRLSGCCALHHCAVPEVALHQSRQRNGWSGADLSSRLAVRNPVLLSVCWQCSSLQPTSHSLFIEPGLDHEQLHASTQLRQEGATGAMLALLNREVVSKRRNIPKIAQ